MEKKPVEPSSFASNYSKGMTNKTSDIIRLLPKYERRNLKLETTTGRHKSNWEPQKEQSVVVAQERLKE